MATEPAIRATAAGVSPYRLARAATGSGLWTRLLALIVAAGCLGVLGIGAWLEPSRAGHGTHTQLGLPPCAWAAVFHKPCPTCGMTTAVSLAAHGRFLRAFETQPFGALVALGLAIGFWSGLYIAMTGSQLGAVYGRMMTGRVLWTLAGLAGVSWGYVWVTWVDGGA